MLTALTREVSRSLASCELTWAVRRPIDIDLAREQHRSYENALTSMGVRVISLPEQPDLPDAVFVEDPLIVVDELAIVTRMGAESRRPEAASLAEAIAPFRRVRHLSAPATLEGGDVIQIGRNVFVGISTRTNMEGVVQLRRELEPFGYQVHSIEVRGCLHLKSACCSLGDRKILANPAWFDPAWFDPASFDPSPFRDYELIAVAPDEPGAANILRVGDAVLMPACFPRTQEVVERHVPRIHTLDISELMKAEAAITCSSVLFDASL